MHATYIDDESYCKAVHPIGSG